MDMFVLLGRLLLGMGGYHCPARHSRDASSNSELLMKKGINRHFARLFFLFLRALALVFVEIALAQADRFGRHLDQFVVVDELQGLLQG